MKSDIAAHVLRKGVILAVFHQSIPLYETLPVYRTVDISSVNILISNGAYGGTKDVVRRDFLGNTLRSLGCTTHFIP
jgi:hypothetical protein